MHCCFKSFGWYYWLHALPLLRKRARARGVHVQIVNNGRYAPDLGIVKQKNIDRLVTMDTSIASGDVWCKYQISSALPQGARSLTEEKEDDDEKIQKSV